MKLLHFAFVSSLTLSSVLAQHDFNNLTWAPAGPDDVRGPCPMLNTLANHGILPHSGKNISEDIVTKALMEGVNFTPQLAQFLFVFAHLTNPNQNSTTFDLNHLGIHNILEHDASLSRTDDFFDPSDAFNQEIFNETTSYWTSDIIDLPTAATSRLARAKTSVKTNPAFEFSGRALGFAYGEVAAYLLVFGDKIAGTAPKALVTSFFETERLPTSLGWVKPSTPIGNLDLCQMAQRVIMATGTTEEKATSILPCSNFDA